MIRLYGFDTVNTLKILIMLEETATPYAVTPINIRAGDQHRSDFLAVNPNRKVPVIVDPQGPAGPLTLTESGAILLYLAEKTGWGLPSDPVGKIRAREWLAYQLSTQGPAFGQCEYWGQIAPRPNDEARAQAQAVAQRVLDQMARRLTEADWFAGADYGVADIAHFAWMTRAEGLGLRFADRQALGGWYQAIAARRAVQAALDRAANLRRSSPA